MTRRTPVTITCQGLSKSPSLERWVERLVENKLEPVCDHMSRCRVAITKPVEHPRRGSGFRVHLDIMVPPSHEVVVRREPHEGDIHDNFYTVLQSAFAAARRQLERITERQQGKVKQHPQHTGIAVIRDLGATYGTLRTLGGRDVPFHRNAVVHDDYDDLEVGMSVNFEERRGESGVRASSVRVVDHRPS